MSWVTWAGTLCSAGRELGVLRGRPGPGGTFSNWIAACLLGGAVLLHVFPGGVALEGCLLRQTETLGRQGRAWTPAGFRGRYPGSFGPPMPILARRQDQPIAPLNVQLFQRHLIIQISKTGQDAVYNLEFLLRVRPNLQFGTLVGRISTCRGPGVSVANPGSV